MYLWRAVDSEGELLDVLVQSSSDQRAVYFRHARPRTRARLMGSSEIAGRPPR